MSNRSPKPHVIDVTWQKFRLTTLQAYHPLGGWNTLKGANENIARLTTYCTCIKDDHKGTLIRFERAKELLASSRRNLNTATGTNSEAAAIQERLAQFRRKVINHTDQLYEFVTADTVTEYEPNWTAIADQVRALHKDQRDWFDRLLTDIDAQIYRVRRRYKGRIPGQYQPQVQFLGVLYAVEEKPEGKTDMLDEEIDRTMGHDYMTWTTT